ncbi:DUF5810 domain-containing protein [Natronorarus salvus]|uniref:DUF5810 domain-containing protein n=1 Tax=Natronorarus salvus TaxID=3117733 RepID=UPI002F263219
MGYACPVCEAPQRDAAHLANHLAFTAIGGDDAHETWLDDHVPDWGERDPAGLGAEVSEYAQEREVEATTEERLAEGDAHGGPTRRPDLDAEAQEVLAEAEAMTREMIGRPEGGNEESESGTEDG